MAARFTRVACLAAKQAARRQIDSGSCSALQRPFPSPRAFPQSFSCRNQGVLQGTLQSQVLHSGAAHPCMHANPGAGRTHALLPHAEARLSFRCAGMRRDDTCRHCSSHTTALAAPPAAEASGAGAYPADSSHAVSSGVLNQAEPRVQSHSCIVATSPTTAGYSAEDAAASLHMQCSRPP